MGSTCTDFLVSTSSYLSGAATIANISGNFYRYSRSASPAEADSKAIRNDFAMIGQDIRVASEKFDNSPDQLVLELS